MSEKRKYKILVAEDNKINIKVAEFTLKSIASQLDFASNGEEVLAMIEKNNYDVILMDVKMPVMDGYDTTKIIRQKEQQDATVDPIKIIAITANNQPEEIKYCMSIGMNDFLAKPFNTNEALAVIESVCEA